MSPTGMTILDARGRYAHPALLCSRASTKWVWGRAGTLLELKPHAFPWSCDADTGVDRGALIEDQRTNEVLQSSDLTAAQWTKVNCTAAKTSTGPDGAANSASRLTATADAAYATQAISSATVTARRYSVFVRRIVGTGAIRLTMDGGATETDVTTQLSTTRYSRVGIGQTLANPTVGVKLATAGDSIDVWVHQEEIGAAASSPIPTAGTTVTRLADSITMALGPWWNPAEGALLVEVSRDDEPAPAPAIETILRIDAGPNDAIRLRASSPSEQVGGLIATVGGVSTTIWSSGVFGPGTRRLTAKWAANDFAFVKDGALIGTATSGALPSGLTTLRLGQAYGAQFWNGCIGRLVIFPRRLSVSAMQSMAGRH